jgi:hypothetical protein
MVTIVANSKQLDCDILKIILAMGLKTTASRFP